MNRSHDATRAIISRTVVGPGDSASGVAAQTRRQSSCSPGPASTTQAAPILPVRSVISSAKHSGDQRCVA